MNGLQKKCENLHFWAFWAKMANFGQFIWPKGQNRNFFKKALGKFLLRLQALTANFHKKVMNGFRETA